MKALPAPLLAHYAQGTTTIATCWRVQRVDGLVLTATSHLEDITFGDDLYLSIAAYLMTDQESNSELAPDNFELEGFLASPSITEADVHAGVWDGATVEMFEVNYADPIATGRNLLVTGTLGEVKVTRSKFTTEVRGLAQKLTRRIIRIMNKECDADLGDARCGVDLNGVTVDAEAITVTPVTVDAVDNNQVIDAVTLGDYSTNHFSGGKVTFLTGLNVGLSMEVMSHSTTIANLSHPMPYTIEVGDTFTIVAGCAKRFSEDCVFRFANGVNFRGFPHLPQSDVYKGPLS